MGAGKREEIFNTQSELPPPTPKMDGDAWKFGFVNGTQLRRIFMLCSMSRKFLMNRFLCPLYSTLQQKTNVKKNIKQREEREKC